mmetsp:Transcript_78556/g.240369  ORF Transcript_78556/g.240369 Transcript_78556/m.240369 type:complete len:275 (+) Transcript_78556:504-1328(+)
MLCKAWTSSCPQLTVSCVFFMQRTSFVVQYSGKSRPGKSVQSSALLADRTGGISRRSPSNLKTSCCSLKWPAGPKLQTLQTTKLQPKRSTIKSQMRMVQHPRLLSYIPRLKKQSVVYVMTPFSTLSFAAPRNSPAKRSNCAKASAHSPSQRMLMCWLASTWVLCSFSYKLSRPSPVYNSKKMWGSTTPWPEAPGLNRTCCSRDSGFPLTLIVPWEHTCICQPSEWKKAVNSDVDTIMSFASHLYLRSQNASLNMPPALAEEHPHVSFKKAPSFS